MFDLANYLINNTTEAELLQTELLKNARLPKKTRSAFKIIPISKLKDYQMAHVNADNRPFTKIFNKYLQSLEIDSIFAICPKNEKRILAFALPNINNDEVLTDIVDTIHVTGYYDFSNWILSGSKSFVDNWAIFHVITKQEASSLPYDETN